MKWHLYRKDDPNTWPQIDCPILIYYPYRQYHDSAPILRIGHWDNNRKQFYAPTNWWNEVEFYYTYIAYVPSGYRTLYPIRCTKENCWCEDGYDDNGYCLDYDNDYACGYKKAVAEYEIEEKAIWKEFE